ncbi:MAG: Type 1 glutamine amidotransferase-like domain-containing protein [Bacteroidetes bacterium]|nr:Type 1 glutamine amidotransferase-like domain-containing protein [Bacteroidota bacterium]MBP7399093.1 Type 1 glutamine amidotransferase-like domain-containing protein [Chitinophagales bacterium]MBK7110209.1 Type 1 glutamine amidotransferase-like domain-containing protein [Bacteroidota bacterium]MBP8754054.1 Type 1 glutamine amidotransferase-like domain-containing protein [Chitinophagales bacterium]MBP9190005.1 Type 1 glutamine amidotransferase-like domain-containing protein [Chitinophagales 
MNYMKILMLLFTVVSLETGIAQSYTNYITGDSADVVTIPLPGIVLAGGATDNDDAMIWMLQRAAGGDVLVIRASGEDGYNDYFFSDLGVEVNSVETIVFNSSDASYDEYVLQQLENCELLFIAGGDQWDYVSMWRNTPVEDKIKYLIHDKKITIGGTSAGCAIMGDAYFSAEFGTVTSAQSLSNPYHPAMAIGYHDFIDHAILLNTITDTHYNNPDRQGRHAAFLARLVTDFSIPAKGIGVNEYTAVCIDENNLARVFGDYPDYEDFAYFIQTNCIEDNIPETCESGNDLTWIAEEQAIKVAIIAGTTDGSNYFDLNDWQTANSVFAWQDWWIDNGELEILSESTPADCNAVTNISESKGNSISVYPNPASDYIVVKNITDDMQIMLYDIFGKQIADEIVGVNNYITFDLKAFTPGMYFIFVQNGIQNKMFAFQKI